MLQVLLPFRSQARDSVGTWVRVYVCGWMRACVQFAKGVAESRTRRIRCITKERCTQSSRPLTISRQRRSGLGWLRRSGRLESAWVSSKCRVFRNLVNSPWNAMDRECRKRRRVAPPSAESNFTTRRDSRQTCAKASHWYVYGVAH